MPRRRELLLLAAGWVVQPALASRHERRELFGSPCDLLVPEGTPERLTEAVWRGLATMNREWNAWKPGELGALNQAIATDQSLQVSPALRRVIAGAAVLERQTGGCFNAAIGGLVAAWGFHADVLGPGTRPRAGALAPWMAPPPSLASLRTAGDRLRSADPRVRLDLGGYAKGVALDWALDLLQRGGVAGALLNLGGNLASMGSAGTRPWQVGIRDPSGPGLVAALATQGREAVVTSGIYERYRVLDGQRCTHIIDPRSGRPARAAASVTVVHRNAALADAAATALLVAGPQEAPRLAARLGLAQVLVIGTDGTRWCSPALAARLA